MNLNKSFLTYSSVIIASVFMIIWGWLLGFSGSTEYIKAEDIKVAIVETGEFSQIVNGYGQLKSKNMRLITATSQALVDEIILKPGAKVSKNDVLLVLKNPVLEMELRNVMNSLKNVKSSQRKVRLEQQREILLQESSLSQLESDAELAALMVEAKQALLVSGIISKLEFKKAELEASQLEKKLNLEKSRLAKLREVHEEQLLILEESVQQANDNFKSVKGQFEQLVVKAGIDGVLQKLPVSLGQSVAVGDELALVGSIESLMAEVTVPQIQAGLIRVGSVAEVDTRNGLIGGKVSRIDPVVKNGAVIVEIDLPQVTQTEIRPMQSIDALIFGESRGNVSSVKKPVGVDEGSQAYIYKMIGEDVATKVQVQFGQLSNQQIEVVSGLEPGDEIIVSSTQITNESQQLKIVN